MKFFLLAFLYLFVFFGSIYGLFVNELTIGLEADPNLNIVLTGWVKNLTCLFGLLLIGVVSAYPLVAAVYRALRDGGKQMPETDFKLQRLDGKDNK